MTTSPDVLRQAVEALDYVKGYLEQRDDWDGTEPLIGDIASLRSALSAAPGECLQRMQEQESVHLAAGEASRVHSGDSGVSAPRAGGSAQ